MLLLQRKLQKLSDSLFSVIGNRWLLLRLSSWSSRIEWHLYSSDYQRFTSLVVYPTKENVSTLLFPGTDTLYLPSMSVMVPVPVPFTITVTPIIGSPLVSFTTPVIWVAGQCPLRYSGRHIPFATILQTKRKSIGKTSSIDVCSNLSLMFLHLS